MAVNEIRCGSEQLKESDVMSADYTEAPGISITHTRRFPDTADTCYFEFCMCVYEWALDNL